MAQVTITINSREYGIACDDGQEARIIKLSRILNEKAQQLTAGGGQINENMLLAMSGLLLADDLLEARQQKAALPQTSMPQPEVKIQTVEKVVEKIVEPNWANIDQELSAVLQNAADKIVQLTKEIKDL